MHPDEFEAIIKLLKVFVLLLICIFSFRLGSTVFRMLNPM
jgi:hypothetical protein